MSLDPSPSSPPPESQLVDAGLDDARIEKCLKDADELKQEGNNHFRAGKWEEALSTYRSALGRLPKHPEAHKPRPPRGADPTEDDANDAVEDREEVDPVPDTPLPKGKWDPECAKARAILNGNVAACYIKIGDHKAVVEACTQALRDDPDYIKALTRRAASNETIDTWSSLASAQEDYEKLLSLVTSSEKGRIQAALNKVKPRAEAKQKQEMGEMMDKLKGLGNSLLGNFGLSTDNFKFEPNGQGGYSVNFSK